jgi:hypothetical protein
MLSHNKLLILPSWVKRAIWVQGKRQTVTFRKESAMLPALTTTRKLATATITAALITALATPPALAWGDKEQNFVAGAASTLLLEGIFFPGMFQPNKGHGRAYAPYPPVTYYPAPAPAPVYVPVRPAPVYYTPAPVSIYSTPAGVAFNSYGQNEQIRIQSALAAGGYYHGTIDGAFGPGTYSAVTAYAAATGKTGLLSTQAGAFSIYNDLLF